MRRFVGGEAESCRRLNLHQVRFLCGFTISALQLVSNGLVAGPVLEENA